MYENVQFVMIACLLLIVGIDFILGIVANPENFDPDTIADKFFDKAKKSNAGIASGEARQKKMIDKLIGQGLIKNIPMLEAMELIFPGIHETLMEHENMAPYALTAIHGILTFLVDKVPIPEALKPAVEQFIGGQQQQQPTTL